MGNQTFYGDGLSKWEHPWHTSKHKQQNEHAYLSYAVLTCAYYADVLVRPSLYLNNNDNWTAILITSLLQYNQVIHALIVNVTLTYTEYKPPCKHWMCLLRYLWNIQAFD